MIDTLDRQGVSHIFGIPGAKIDGVFDVLADHGPQLVVCRHEQNAAFMAAAIGRLTGRPGVCLVTSGPGASNLVTGLLTATTEGDPVVALVGSVPRAHGLKRTHQSVDTVELFRSFAKYSVEVEHPDTVSEAIATAFRQAMTPPLGAAVVTLPYDVMAALTSAPTLARVEAPRTGAAAPGAIDRAAELLAGARLPVVLLGARSATPEAVAALRVLLGKCELPVVETFQSAARCPVTCSTTSAVGWACSGTNPAMSSWLTPMSSWRWGTTRWSTTRSCGTWATGRRSCTSTTCPPRSMRSISRRWS